MRQGLVVIAVLAACGSSDVPLLVGATTRAALVVLLGAGGEVRDTWAFHNPGAVKVARLDGETVAVLEFERSLSELGMSLDGNRLVRATDDDPVVSAPLPMPTRWIELSDGEPKTRAIDGEAFAKRFAAVRVPRVPCRRFSVSEDPRSPIIGGLSAVTALRLGEEAVVLAGYRGTGAPWQSEVLLLRRDGSPIETIDTSSVAGAAYGFTLEDGRVWLVMASLRDGGRQSRRCEIRPEDPLRLDCRTFDLGVLPVGGSFVPIAAAGQRVEGKLDALVLTFDGTLWHGDDDLRWRRVYSKSPGSSLCRVGVQTLVLAFDGPRRGIVGLPAGPLLRFSLDALPSAGDAPLLPLDTASGYCRNFYARFASGAELVNVVDYRVDQAAEATSRVFFRSASEADWMALPTAERLAVNELVPYQDGLLATVENGARPIDLSPQRPELPPRVCASSVVGLKAHHAIPFADGRVFVGDYEGRFAWLAAD